MTTKIYQGDSVKNLEFVVFDGSNVVDLTTALEVLLVISYKNYIFEKYSLVSVLPNYNVMTIKVGTTFTLLFDLTRIQTKSLPVGFLDCEVLVKDSTGEYKTYKTVDFLEVIYAETKDLTATTIL